MPVPTYGAATLPIFQFVDDDGNPISGGKLYTYIGGTSTQAATFRDDAGTANTNPIILDSSGRATIFIAAGTYKFVLKDEDDIEVWSADDISNTGLIALSGDILGTTDVQVVANKLIGTSNTFTIWTNRLTLQDPTVNNKQAQFSVSGITAGATRTLGLPDGDTTLVGENTQQAITNKFIRKVVSTYSANGAITIQDSIVLLSNSPAGAMTLASPTSLDGVTLTIISTTAYQHTVTCTAGFNNGGTASDVATFGGAVGDSMMIAAAGGIWYVLNLRNVTLA